MRNWFAKLLLYGLLAVLVTWPATIEIGAAVPGSDRTDTWNSLWSLQVWADHLRDASVPWRLERLNFPDGGVLLVSDPIGATLAAPVVWTFGAPVAFTFLVLFQLTMTGLVMHGFAAQFLRWRRGTGPDGLAPWVSGVALMMSPLLASHVHNGASESWSVGWTVLAVWMVWRDAVSPSLRHLCIAAVALCLASAAHWYGGLVAFIFGLSIAVVGVGGEFRRVYLRRLTSLALGLALTVGYAAASASVHRADDSIVEIKTEEMVRFTTRSTGSADPLTYVLPGDHRSPDFNRMSGNNERFIHGHYLGWVLLGLAAWALIRQRGSTGFLVLGGSVSLLLSLGPVLMHSARPLLLMGDLAIPMPFFLLEALPGFDALSLPWKLSLGPVVALSMLAGVAVDQRGTWRPMLAIGLIAFEAWIVAPTAERERTVPVVSSTSLEGLRAAPPGAVINYPLAQGRAYLAEQLVHQKPIAGTLNRVGNETAARLWRRIHAERNDDPDSLHEAVSSTAKRLGIRYLVIHTDPDAEPDMYTSTVATLEQLFGVPEWGQGPTRVVQLW